MKEIPLYRTDKVILVDDDRYNDICRAAKRWTKQVNKRTGRIYARGYVVIDGKRKQVFLHQYLLPGELLIDHEDNNGLNNQIGNLRPATYSQNGCNSEGWSKRLAAGLKKGVYREGNRYRAMICVNKKRYELGRFDTQEEAVAARLAGERVLHGEFARNRDAAVALATTT